MTIVLGILLTDGNNIYSIDDHCLDVDFKDLNLKMKKKIKLNGICI